MTDDVASTKKKRRSDSAIDRDSDDNDDDDDVIATFKGNKENDVSCVASKTQAENVDFPSTSSQLNSGNLTKFHDREGSAVGRTERSQSFGLDSRLGKILIQVVVCGNRIAVPMKLDNKVRAKDECLIDDIAVVA